MQPFVGEPKDVKVGFVVVVKQIKIWTYPIFSSVSVSSIEIRTTRTNTGGLGTAIASRLRVEEVLPCSHVFRLKFCSACLSHASTLVHRVEKTFQSQ